VDMVDEVVRAALGVVCRLWNDGCTR
jgi:hypothetical protein